MGQTVDEWLLESPAEIRAALKHIQEKFARAHFGYGQTPRHFCYARLHNEAIDDPISEHARYLAHMQRRLGPGPSQTFNFRLAEGTPSAIFKAFYDLYIDNLVVDILLIFKDLLDMGAAWERQLGLPTISWAAKQAKFLVHHEVNHIGIWIRDACDKRAYDPTEDPEEMIFWRKWQAPSFLVMVPSKYRPYDAGTAWERNDLSTSLTWLEKFKEDYLLRLETKIDAASGHMAIELAKRPAAQRPADASTPAQQPKAGEVKSKSARQEVRKLKTQDKYRLWRREYRRLVKVHPDQSDVWRSQRIARMEIAESATAETIRKHMKT